jgi:hypothetical protein
MGTREKASELEKKIKKQCVGHDPQEIGFVLSCTIVALAQKLEIPKYDFLRMLDDMWELQLEDGEEDFFNIRH